MKALTQHYICCIMNSVAKRLSSEMQQESQEEETRIPPEDIPRIPDHGSVTLGVGMRPGLRVSVFQNVAQKLDGNDEPDIAVWENNEIIMVLPIELPSDDQNEPIRLEKQGQIIGRYQAGRDPSSIPDVCV